jgi:hypothetical protein
MDNRNRDKMDNDSTDRKKDVSQEQRGSSQFGKKIGQSEGLGSSSGRTSGSSGLGSSSNKPSGSTSSDSSSSRNDEH